MQPRSLVALLSLTTIGLAQTSPPPQLPSALLRHKPYVVHDDVDGRHWAAGDTYKASFGPEGFTLVPNFGSAAPANHPLRLSLRSVAVGGRQLPFAREVPAIHTGDRVSFVRGAVREDYDLTLQDVEQTFTIDTELAGDVVLELAVTSDLVEDAERPGLQFGNALGSVDYGTAYLLDGTRRQPIASGYGDGAIRLTVPAAMRGDGPVVIDPLLTVTSIVVGGAQDSLSPDISYDYGMNAYMVTWEYAYSATDHDVYCVMLGGDGLEIANTFRAVDVTTIHHVTPRAANMNLWNRHMVVMERHDPTAYGGRSMIWGRTVEATGLAVNPFFLVSDPSFAGENFLPAIGGDSDLSLGRCCVVWQHNDSPTQQRIFGAIVDQNGGEPFGTSTLSLSNGFFANPQISQTNRIGTGPTVGWKVVYQYRFSASDWDIHASTIDPFGTVTQRVGIDLSPGNDFYPYVSSPALLPDGRTVFMITYERQGQFVAMGKVVTDNFLVVVPPTDLSTTFGLGGFWVRVDSDSQRFAVLTGGATISAATLAVVNGALVMQGAPQALAGTPAYPLLCSRRSGNGPVGEYGIAWVDQGPNPDTIRMSIYGGWATNGGVTRRVMACGALGIEWLGMPALGTNLVVSLTNVGSDLPATAFGFPGPQVGLCLACSTGLDLLQPMAFELTIGSRVIPIPPLPELVGNTYSVQGFAIGSGNCLGTIRFSDTLDFTVQ